MKVEKMILDRSAKFLMIHNISIWLDTYDDIFSDFDFRPYAERAFSDDFISEVKKVCREKKESVNEVKLYLPENKRNVNDEKIIGKRLSFFFKNNHTEFLKLSRKLILKGSLSTLIGFILMLIASYIASLRSSDFMINSLLIFLEPSGWFLVWTGLEILFYSSKKNKKDLDFFSKLSKSKITFFTI